MTTPRDEAPPPDETSASTAGYGQIRLLARGSAILVSTGVVSYAGSFLLGIVLARNLGVLAFGMWAISYSLTRLISIVGLFGADWLVLRQGSYYEGIGDIPRLRRTLHVALMIAGGGLGVLSVIVLIAAETIAVEVFDEPALAPLLRLTALMAPIVGVRQILVYGTQAFKQMKDAALVRNVLQPTMALVFVGVTVVVTDDVVLAFTALLVSETILMVVSLALLRRRMPLFGPVDEVPTREFIGFALPAWFTRLAGQTRAQVLTIMLGSLASIATSAVFTAANRISGVLFSIVTSLNQVYTAIASDLYLQGRKREWADTYKSVTKWTFMLGAPLLTFMLVFPKELLTVYGAEFRDGWEALIAVSIGMLFHFGTGPVTVTLVLIGRPKLALLDYVIVIAVEIGLALLLIPRYGLMGGAIAKGVGTATNNVVPLVQVWWYERTWPFRWDFWKPAAAAVLAAGIGRTVVSAADVGDGVVAAAIGAAVIGVCYLVLILVFRLSAEDRAALDAIKLRRGRKGVVAAAVPDDAPFVSEN